jgi:hypothetical protein
MNLKQFRQNPKQFFTESELVDLALLLSFKCSKEKKDIIVKVIKYNFYGYFLEQEYVYKFEHGKNGWSFRPSKQELFREELNKIRESILKDFREDKI